jgi:lysozyme family protein
MKPADFIRGYIQAHEGGLSVDRDDRGNWHHGALVGSKFGVTGDVLARYRGVPAVAAGDVVALTLDEAVSIGMDLFYKAPHFDLLLWDRSIASVVDMGWGAGPAQAMKLLQRIIGARDDGQVGPITARSYVTYVSAKGEEAAARAYAAARNAFYDNIIAIHPTNAKFRGGWRNRTASFLPGTAWWRSFGA